MITLFTTTKPFVGHNGVIQRNALRSWTLLHPDLEIILFGDDAGAGEVARELGLRHEPQVERNEFGTLRIDAVFGGTQALARHDVVCYANCDIMLLPDFLQAIDRVRSKYKQFLAIGRRWNLDILESIDFLNPDWQKNVRNIALINSKTIGS